MKVLLAHVLAFCILVPFTTQAGAESISVVMGSEANLYQEALEGFREVVRHRIVSVQTLKENPTTWRDEMRKLRSTIEPDLVFVIGTSALQAVAGEITNIPVVHSMVFNPFSNTTSTGKNVVGISMTPAVGQVISLLRELNPKIRRVGTIWDPSRNVLLISQVRSVFQKEGIQLVSREIRSAGEIGAALISLEKEIDVLWLWPDEAFLADDILQRVYLFSFDSKIPVLGLSERHTEMGALLSLSYASAKDMGRQAGEAANRLLDDSPTAVVSHIQARQLKLTVNLKTARKLNIKIPETIVQRAGNTIKAPLYRNGDWWVFKTKKIYANGKIEVEDHRVTFRNGAFQTNETSFLRGEDIALTPSFLPFATVHLTDPARKWLDFPLAPGKLWSFQYRRRSFTSEDDLKPRYLGGSRVSTWVDANAEVMGYKSVVTPAGKFDAIEINRWDVLHRPAYLTYLYSPQSKSVIKLEADIEFRDSETGATRFELELIAYGNEAVGKSDSR